MARTLRFKKILTGVNKIISLLLLTLSCLSTILHFNFISTQAADVQLFNNPEAFLTVQFQDNTDLIDTLNKLPKNNNYGITNFTGVIQINNHPFPISVTGNNTINNIKTEYQGELSSFLSKLSIVKQTGTKELKEKGNANNVNTQIKENLNITLNKVSTSEINKSRLRAYFNNGSISLLTLVGHSNELTLIQTKLAKYSKTNNLITKEEINRQQQEIQAKIDQKVATENKTREQATKETLDEELVKSGDKLPKVTTELSQTSISKVDSILKTDPSGNKFTTTEELNQLQLTDAEKTTIKTLLTNYNNAPEIETNNIKPILDTLNIEVKENIIEKVGSAASGFVGGIKAEAGWCSGQINVYPQWWGQQIHINQCNIDTINFLDDSISSFSLGLTLVGCSWTCGAILGILQFNKAYINFLNSRCNGDGVMLNRAWNGEFWFWSVC